jgi:2-hydroxychromene-2-carboxylate isomerase
MSRTSLRFYFDYISPNAYLAWTQLPALAGRFGVAVEPVPVLFAGLLDAHRRVGPAETPAHIRWMWKNVLRKATLLGVPFHPPAFHPFNPLLALRASSLPLPAAGRMTLIDALFQAVWVQGLHIAEADVVRSVADGAGLAGGELVAAAGSAQSKAGLRGQTDDAFARGVFGVPSMEVDGELFWGYDDFPQLTRFLSGADTLDPNQWASWSAPLRASAVRKRTGEDAP